jgi:predicted phosphodiesterase
VERYVNLIKEFAKTTQFIVVTHNNHDGSRADALRHNDGKSGVSKVMSVNLAERASPRRRQKKEALRRGGGVMLIGYFPTYTQSGSAGRVLERFKREGVSSFIYCGDMIGYGPDPEKCVRKIASLNLAACVLGNHDAVFVQPELEAFFNYDAKVALDASKEMMSEKSVRYLSSLPAAAHGTDFTVVHGTPADPIKEYFSSCAQFRSNYDLWQGHVCFVGHTHLPFYIKGTRAPAPLLK